jgi:competence protein ComEC
MLAINGAVIGLAYVLGLLLTGIAGQVGRVPVGAIGLLLTGPIAAFLVPRCWRTGPSFRIWLMAGLVGFLAVFYLQWRVPHPASTDISRLISGLVSGAEAIAPVPTFRVEGQIKTSPRLTQSQRIQFELKATRARALEQDQTDAKPDPETTAQFVTGSVYVTVPLLQGTGLYPGQVVTVTGSLYAPKPAANPGGFDFAQYLTQQGIFAGLSGKQVDIAKQQAIPPLLWTVRQRIVRAQVQGLGVPEGPIVSAMVMGGRSVDIPHTIRDQFRRAGLAHALAASGAQVSLLVGVVLALTQRLSPKLRLILGSGILLLYLCLTGLEASVLRAGVMGFVALLALTLERKVKPLASILFAATLLLVLNPLWIWELGFQLSFLATLGLLITVPVLTRWLDWMPSGLTPLFTVPIAAYLWTLPLILFAFGVVSPCSLLVNILTSPLITLISIGGMLSALAALIYPMAGSGLAGLLYYPTHLFIQMAAWGSQLPGSSWAIGTITIAQLVLLYGLIGLIWIWRKSQRYWWTAAMVGFSLVALPAWYASTHLLQATILTTPGQSVLVWQDRGRVALLNSGSEAGVKFTVLPFLQKQGINRIDWAIAPTLHPADLEGWQRILANLSIREFYSNVKQGEEVAEHTSASANRHLWLTQLKAHQGTALTLAADRTLQLGSATVQCLSQNPPALSLHLADQHWLLLPDRLTLAQQTALVQGLPVADVVWWTGGELSPTLLEAIQPKVAIVSERSIPAQTRSWLQSHQVEVLMSDRDGAIQWTPQTGFKTMLEAS